MNGDLHVTRQFYEYRNFSNLYTLEYDRAKAEEGIRALGANDIRSYKDLEFQELSKVLTNLAKELRANSLAGKKTFVYFQYGGHGTLDGYTYAICNSEKKNKVRFPLEKILRSIAKISNTYMLAVFDCCREKMVE